MPLDSKELITALTRIQDRFGVLPVKACFMEYSVAVEAVVIRNKEYMIVSEDDFSEANQRDIAGIFLY